MKIIYPFLLLLCVGCNQPEPLLIWNNMVLIKSSERSPVHWFIVDTGSTINTITGNQYPSKNLAVPLPLYRGAVLLGHMTRVTNPIGPTSNVKKSEFYLEESAWIQRFVKSHIPMPTAKMPGPGSPENLIHPADVVGFLGMPALSGRVLDFRPGRAQITNSIPSDIPTDSIHLRIELSSNPFGSGLGLAQGIIGRDHLIPVQFDTGSPYSLVLIGDTKGLEDCLSPYSNSFLTFQQGGEVETSDVSSLEALGLGTVTLFLDRKPNTTPQVDSAPPERILNVGLPFLEQTAGILDLAGMVVHFSRVKSLNDPIATDPRIFAWEADLILDQYLKLQKISPNSWIASVGFLVGDKVLRVNQTPVANLNWDQKWTFGAALFETAEVDRQGTLKVIHGRSSLE